MNTGAVELYISCIFSNTQKYAAVKDHVVCSMALVMNSWPCGLQKIFLCGVHFCQSLHVQLSIIFIGFFFLFDNLISTPNCLNHTFTAATELAISSKSSCCSIVAQDCRCLNNKWDCYRDGLMLLHHLCCNSCTLPHLHCSFFVK